MYCDKYTTFRDVTTKMMKSRYIPLSFVIIEEYTTIILVTIHWSTPCQK
ncbi:hypothetical protein M087_1096 [Bacteroides fragilis str. S23 R14]|nr:hypothetical protein M087_1096 [Bacteroides fragilis str. S23 R14]EYA67445.1 hypothetical protein M139_1188 [Bacteroides fragilis str. S23L24]EYE46630.1 hypothetical protein M138_1172 [Bacteroides fragilis str. S23L17]